MREEDDLRAALHTLERLTPDPDRMLSAIRASGPSAPPRPSRRRRRAVSAPRTWWDGLIAPLAAAVAVVAVVACSIVVTKALTWRAGDWEHRVSTTAPPFPTSGGLPAYFLATAGKLNSDTLGTANYNRLLPRPLRSHDTVGIIATATGKVAATVRLPGYVSATAASAGAFFAAVVSDHQATFYEIRLAAGGTGARAARLPIPPVTTPAGVPASPIGYIAASPDGSKLAISIEVPQGHSAYSAQNLIVAATATGTERRWTAPVQAGHAGMGSMTWLADGKTLALNWYAGTAASPATALRLLDTAAAGHNLLLSRAVLPFTNHGSYFNGYTISPDGKALVGIVGCVTGGCRPGSPGMLNGHRLTVGSVVQFSAASGQAVVRYTDPELPGVPGHQQDSGCSNPLWISKSASRMLLLCFVYRPGTRTQRAVIDPQVLLLAGGVVGNVRGLTAAVSEYTAFPGVTAYNGIPSFPLNP